MDFYVGDQVFFCEIGIIRDFYVGVDGQTYAVVDFENGTTSDILLDYLELDEIGCAVEGGSFDLFDEGGFDEFGDCDFF